MPVLDFSKQVNYAVENVLHGNYEAMLGRALIEPFASVNSGSRKLMFAKELEQVIPPKHGEKAINETGYEIRYGELSSSIVTTDDDYVCIAKIPKFSFAPDHHYYMIMVSATRKMITVEERVSYTHITETYGYLRNNSYMDNIKPGDLIPKGTDLTKSTSFDRYGNRMDGLNLTTIYMGLDYNYEDSIILRDEIADKYTVVLLHPVSIMIPDNCIPLNLHGNDQVYKIIPDIGEPIPDCIVAGFRTEVKDESYYSQQKVMLKKITMPDDKYIVRGDDLRVIDIDIHPNNPDILRNSPYYAQLNMYYQENLRFCTEIEKIVGSYKAEGYALSYKLEHLYHNSKRILRGDKFMGKKEYNNLVMDIMVLEERPVGIGDKLADRNGGKGVVSNIWPTGMMPRLPDGTVVDAIINSPTMYGRENPAQCLEVEITHVARELINYIENNNVPAEEALKMIIKYVRIVVPNQADELEHYVNTLGVKDSMYFLASVLDKKYIDISSKPMSESFDIDRLNQLYQAFPFIDQVDVYVPLEDSNGNMRFVKSRRKTTVGKRYTLRLKQYSQEKFSAVSLSSTNLKNENVKSKAATNYRSAHSSTCNRLGYQEAGCLSHMGQDYTVTNLMIHSVSPHARRLCQAFLTDDPYDTDIKITNESRNRNAEFAYTYLKTIGLQMTFRKELKVEANSAMFNCVTFRGKPEEKGARECVNFITEPGYDFWEAYKRRERLGEELTVNKDKMIYPVVFRMRNDKWHEKQ